MAEAMAITKRPWGWFETLAEGEGYLIKRLWIAPHQRISLQRHQHRQEHWYVALGGGSVTINDQDLEAPIGSTFDVPCGSIHRAEAGFEGMLMTLQSKVETFLVKPILNVWPMTMADK